MIKLYFCWFKTNLFCKKRKTLAKKCGKTWHFGKISAFDKTHGTTTTVTTTQCLVCCSVHSVVG